MRIWIVPALLTSGLAFAQEPTAQSGKEYEALLASFAVDSNAASGAQRRFYASEEYKRLSAARDREAINKLTAELPKVDYKAHGERFLAAARRYEGTEAALPFLLWTLVDNLDAPSAAEAARMILSDHRNSPELLKVAQKSFVLDRLPQEDAAAFRRAMIESPHSLVSAWTRYREVRPLIRSRDLDEAERMKAQKVADGIAAEHPGTLLAKTILGPRFVEERLQMGMEAPDIVGEDLDGVKFSLSDYRGKVVVIDFWGDW